MPYIKNMNSQAQQTDLSVAETILSQLGGNRRLAVMCGCKDFAGDSNSVQFRVGSNGKKVTASDTYTVEFYAGRGSNMRKVYEASDIYADALRGIFEAQTGMYLSL